MTTTRYNGSDEMTPEQVFTVCQNPTCNRRDSYYGHELTAGNYGKDKATGRNLVLQPRRGRRALYCSGACRVNACEHRKALREAEEARRAAIAAQEERDRQAVLAHERMQRQVENVISLALTQALPKNSRPTTTTIKHAAEHATRSLILAGIVS